MSEPVALDLVLLTNELNEVTDPYRLGIKLAIELHDVKKILQDAGSIERQKSEILDHWLKNDSNASWPILVKALKEMAHNSLAERLEKTYGSQEAEGTYVGILVMKCHHTLYCVKQKIKFNYSPESQIAITATATAALVPKQGRFLNLKFHIVNFVPLTGQMTVQYIQDDIRQFEKRFNALKKSTRECLERLRVPVKEVAVALTSLPADDMDEHKLFLKENKTDIYRALDHSELFGTLDFHWNYQNPQLLDHIIREFNLEGVKSEMKTYKEDLQQFRKKTPLKLFCQSQKKKHIEPPPDFLKIVAKFDWPDTLTLEDVEEFRQKYACHYSLRECAMMLDMLLIG